MMKKFFLLLITGVTLYSCAKASGTCPDTLLKEPAPNFNLEDVHGKTVSLADFKGKILVIDFWATWCGPCQKSFPAMQILVDRYKSDPNVQFVFIDTWERDADYMDKVVQLLNRNKYTFNVLFDEAGDQGIQNAT